MRDFQPSLSQTQSVRLQAALQQLQDLSSRASSTAAASVAVADTIPVNNEDGILKGHGTSELDGQLVATLCGVIEEVNKLFFVRAFRARYKPEVGDIIVGRVIEIAPKCWRLEINFSQEAVLMLSSMSLPDGIQRRKTAVDEHNMRSIFEENDVVCAEVHKFNHDGTLHLQASSQKYGKLERGQLLSVSPYLVKRRKQRFHHLEQYGVDLILGCNGFIWVGEHSETGGDDMALDKDNTLDEVGVSDSGPAERTNPLEVGQHIRRIANAVRLLSGLGFSLSIEAIVDTAEACTLSNVDIGEMLGGEFYVQTVEREVQRRVSLLKRKG